MRAKAVSLIVLAVVVIVYSIYISLPAGQAAAQRTETIVTKVIDGDTLVIEGGQRVRLLNIDTRERGENCYTEAKKRLEELTLLKNVTLERDKEDKDRYDRLLRHIYVGNISANLQLAKEGLAVAYIYEPNVKYREAFAAAEQEGKAAKGCVWMKLP